MDASTKDDGADGVAESATRSDPATEDAIDDAAGAESAMRITRLILPDGRYCLIYTFGGAR